MTTVPWVQGILGRRLDDTAQSVAGLAGSATMRSYGSKMMQERSS
jgi:hypothetical protein